MKTKISVPLLAIYFTLAEAGYKQGMGEEPIKVHFVPHSHMDAGWLKTYDDYYKHEVKRLFKSVFDQLGKDLKYTYTIGDIAFFRRYYNDAKPSEQSQI